jgi:hypothetical protein
MTLKSSIVISRPYNLYSLIDLSGLCSLYGVTELYSPISSKDFMSLVVGSSLAPKLSKMVPFCGMGHQKSIFY